VADPSSSQTASKLRHLLDETADLIDSPSFSFVLTLLNNEGFSTLVDTKCANEAFKASPVPEAAPQSFDSMATVVPSSTAERKTKLANLLAVLARQAHVIGNGSHAPNEYLAAMDQNVRELEAFSAVIYSSNFDLELPSASKAAADPEIEQEFGSSSYAAVMVEKETEVGSDLGQSAPTLLDNDEGISINVAQKGQESEDTPGESAFERAWGKAVEDGTSPQSEGQVS
jgi:peroxin-3